MKFRVKGTLGYDVQSPTSFILNIHAMRTTAQTVLDESFHIDPYFKTEELSPATNQNRYMRFEIYKPCHINVSYEAMVETATKISEPKQLNAVPVMQLPPDVISYLYPSRYCQSDKLHRFANSRFGKIKNAFEKVLALTNWIHDNVEYLSGSTDSQTSAFDTATEQAGVCRDFAHLGIALCRALDIPARYFTGYSYLLKQSDFHACFEAFLGGEWVLFDATRLAPINGMVKIATGRDAADTSIATIFGNVRYTSMWVSCDLADDNFEPVYYDNEKHFGLTYL